MDSKSRRVCGAFRFVSSMKRSTTRSATIKASCPTRFGISRASSAFNSSLCIPSKTTLCSAGPGDSWTVDQFGNAVGKTNGRPMIQLDDLLVALRTVGPARVSCSIDPTPEGILRMQSEMRKHKTFQPRVIDQIERALGPQQISLTGIPETSHFARVLVAADYRMKRIAMDLEQAPVKQLPSFLDMLANSRARLTNMMPRWWLACDYEPLARSEDGLAWELRGPGVQVMTEDDMVKQDGTRTESGRKSDLAVKWAETMNARYEELSVKQPIFGQLRNLMDMCVVAAVMEKHRLIERAGCDISLLTRSDSDLVLESWNAPRTVSTQCSFTKRGREYLITASGGVEIESWQVAENSQVDATVRRLRDEAAGAGDAKRWWN